jgi:hypothetical protein
MVRMSEDRQDSTKHWTNLDLAALATTPARPAATTAPNDADLGIHFRACRHFSQISTKRPLGRR